MKAFTFGKTKIKIYGGFNSIGGNCVVIDSPSLKVMFDQGVNFTQLKNFYGFSIQPDSVEELREMNVLPPRSAYEDVEEIYVSHLHLDHLGSLNIPGEIPVYLPSKEVAEVLSRSWWFGWKQQLLPQTLSFIGFKNVEESKRVKYERISHSAFPSYAFRVDADDASILYTGDFRNTPLHSILHSSIDSLGDLASDGVDVLIIEGTNFGRKISYISPTNFKQSLLELLEKYDRNIFFVTTHPLDLEATLSIIEIAGKAGYIAVFTSLYYAYLLDIMLDKAKYEVQNELIFTPITRTKAIPLNNFEIETSLKTIRDRKIAFFTPIPGIKEMKTIPNLLNQETKGLLHITVIGEPVDEEWVIEERKIENWLKLLGILSYRVHVSGHYQPYEFKEIIQTINPKKIIPIHTLTPRTMVSLFERIK